MMSGVEQVDDFGDVAADLRRGVAVRLFHIVVVDSGSG
jgi:hypothetical protein